MTSRIHLLADAALVLEKEGVLTDDQREATVREILLISGLNHDHIEALVVKRERIEFRDSEDAAEGQKIAPSAQRLVACVSSKRGAVVTYDDVAVAIWGQHIPKSPKSTIFHLIATLKGKEQQIGGSIVSVHGRGLRWVAVEKE